MNDKPMNCPHCGTEMTRGIVSVHGTFLGFLAVGFSYQHLWFESGGDSKKVLGSGDTSAGYRCEACDAILIQPGTRATID
jgi:hypothetical protein